VARNYVDTIFDLGNGCSIDGCPRRLYAKGFCQAHYARNRKYGDPLAGRTGWGEVRTWIETIAIPYEGDGCLLFPFARNDDGYARIRVDGQSVAAHAYVLSKTFGPKTDKQHECCHS
jgi:hypothetical protein